MKRWLWFGVAGLILGVVVFTLFPRPTSNTAAVTRSGVGLSVPAGGDLQAALDAARPGDVIELQADATFVGNFVLPHKPGAQWIIIRSSAHERLPPSGSRISPENATFMPRIVSPNRNPAISTARGAHHFQFIGIEITPTDRVNFNLIRVEAPNQTSADDVPTDIIFDRCYIHGTPAGNIRRGIAMNGARLAVIGSHLSDFHERGADSQAIAGWNGMGPFKIVNNYLEGAGENVMFGGATPTIPNLVPSDIEVRGNYFAKPVSWRGSAWTIKNLFELKNAQRVLIDGNVFEYNWLAAQNGFSILFTVRGEGGTAPWAIIHDVTFTNNIVRHVAQGINILGRDDLSPSGQTQRVLIQNNLFVDVGGSWGDGRLFQLLNNPADVTINHNTAFQTDSPIVAAAAATTGFVFTNNITPNNLYGVAGDGTFGNPLLTLATYFPGYVFARNAIVGGNLSSYPPDNFFPASLNQVGFVNLAGGDYPLARSSPYRRASTEKRDIGVDFSTLATATARP
jgi:hypothetical protein